MRAGLAVIAGVIVSGALATTAHADRADQLFKKGKKLLGEKKYAEACTAFEQSDRLDPEIGAKLNVALCYREWGKLATAWRWFTEAEQMAIKAGDDRAKRIHALIAELDPSVPRLKLSLPPDAVLDGVAVRLDGAELAPGEIGEDRRVDPGPHRIETVVNGAARSKTVAVERGGTDVVLDVPVKPRPRGAPGATGKSGTTTAPDIGDPAQTRRWLGLGVSGAGVVAIGIAGIVTLRARSDYDHALAGYCGGAIDMCDDTGVSRTHSARHHANIATGVTIAGLAAVGGGLFLYFTARSEPRERSEHAFYLAPALGDATGLVVGGAF